MIGRTLGVVSMLMIAGSAPGVCKALDLQDPVPGVFVLNRSASIDFSRQHVRVSVDRVSVECRASNRARQLATSEISFPVPDYGYDPMIVDYDTLEDVQVWVAGQRVPVARLGRALQLGSDLDITDSVHRAGLTVEDLGGVRNALKVLANGSHLVVKERSPVFALPADVRAGLEAKGVLRPDAEGGGPGWYVRSAYRWTQVVDPAKTVDFKVEYLPMRMAVVAGSDDAAAAASCIPAPIVESAMHASRLIVTVAVRVSGDVDLEVEPPKNGVASFCWNGQAVVVDRAPARVSAAAGSAEKVVMVGFVVPHA